MVSCRLAPTVSASLPGVVHADGRDHGFVVQVLAELDVLLEQRWSRG